MPQSGLRWRHVVISTHNSWLPGDARGFRSKGHRIHSSGDYKNPPPDGEHAGLHRYSKRISAAPVVIPSDLRSVVAHAILGKLHKLKYRVLALSVAGMHVHILVEFPDKPKTIRHILGQCKSVSSHAIRDRLPGRVWAYGGKYLGVGDQDHHRNAYIYILDQEDGWIWDFKPQGERSEPWGLTSATHENPPQLAS